MTEADLAAFDAWLDDVAPPTELREYDPGDLFARLRGAGERYAAVAAIHPHLVRLVSSESVLLAITGYADPIEVQLLAIERDEDGDEAYVARHLVVRVLGGPPPEDVAGRAAQIVYQVGRQIFSLECDVHGGPADRFVLAYPRALVYFPGRAFPRVRTQLEGGTSLRLAGGEQVDASVVDVGYGGAGCLVAGDVEVGEGDAVKLVGRWSGMAVDVEASVANCRETPDGRLRLGLSFSSTEPMVMRVVRDLMAAG